MTGEAQSEGLPAVAGEPAAPEADAEARLAEIRQYRLTNRAKYFADADVLAEERRLLAGSSGEVQASAPDERQPGDLVPLEPVSEWIKTAEPDADRDTYRRTVDAANVVLRHAGEDAASLETSFEALPETVRGAAVGELVNRRSVPVEPLSGDEIDAMLADPANAELAREWGGDAPRKFATVRGRLFRAVERLSEAETEALARWLEGQGTAARAALFRSLAGEGGRW